jgi:hypothetical protein
MTTLFAHTVIGLDHRLASVSKGLKKRGIPEMEQEERAAVIKAAVESGRLKPSTSEAAILKILERRRTPRKAKT